MVKYRYTPEALAAAVAQSRNIAEVMRLLGVRISGGSHAHISRRIKHLGIDTSHFTGRVHNRGRSGPRRPVPQRLVKLPPDSRRVPGTTLKHALRMIGLPEKCEKCGVGTTWQGLPLTLHVDHINGDFLDNRARNLRLLCPNCHSQTPTFAGNQRGAAVASDVDYDAEAVTPTGFPIGRRLPGSTTWSWTVRVYKFKGP